MCKEGSPEDTQAKGFRLNHSVLRSESCGNFLHEEFCKKVTESERVRVSSEDAQTRTSCEKTQASPNKRSSEKASQQALRKAVRMATYGGDRAKIRLTRLASVRFSFSFKMQTKK